MVGSKNLPCVRHFLYTVNINGLETEVQPACSRPHIFQETGQEFQPDFLDSRTHALLLLLIYFAHAHILLKIR